MNQDFYHSNSLGFDQPQPPQSPVIHQPPQELSIQETEDLKQQYLDELKRLSNLEYRDEIKIAKLTENFNDEDYTFAITPNEPVLSIEKPDNSLCMGDEHLDTIPATESDKFIKSSVENLIPIPSKSEGIPEHMCDVPSHDNALPLDVSKDQIEDFSDSKEEVSSIDDDSFSLDNINYVEASPPDSEFVSSEVMEIVIPEVEGIDDDILLMIKDDILREKLLNVNLLIAKIEALNANPTPSSDCKTKSSSTSLNSLLEETNTFDNFLPKFKTFCFDVEAISSGSTTTHSDLSHSDLSLLEYEAFYAASLENHPPMLNKDKYTDDELTENELKQVEANDQAIQTILLGLPEDIYAAVDSYETAQEIWLRVQQMMKGYDIRIQEKKAKLFNEWEMFTSTYEESIESYYHCFSKLMDDFKRNKHFPEKTASTLKFLNNLQPE
nr:hypothetical protein [Tanacetum cinerariifolium]